MVAVQTLAVASLAIVAASLAARRAEALVVDRLDAVIATLGRSTFPLTPAVLDAMRGLSGAHFVVIAAGGDVRESTLPAVPSPMPAIDTLPSRVRLDAEGRSSVIELAGDRYVAASVRSSGGADRPTLLVLYPENAWKQARWDAAMPPVGVGVLALAAMMAVTGFVADRLGRRVRSLEEKAAAIASGDFRPLDIDARADEIADLASAINRMCLQLQEMRSTIRRTERAGVLAQLAAGLAHSLRNAATGARMAVQLHARRCPSAADDQSLNVALRQLALGEEHVKSLLAIGQPGPTSKAVVSVSRLVEDVAALVEPACRHAKVSFHHEADDALKVLADAESLRAAVLNLTLNAIEAAGAEGFVRLSASGDEHDIKFIVEDSGAGPPLEFSETLFDPFVTGKPEGVGLGLAVVKRVAIDHGGSVSWQRAKLTTRFTLTLPGIPKS